MNITRWSLELLCNRNIWRCHILFRSYSIVLGIHDGNISIVKIYFFTFLDGRASKWWVFVKEEGMKCQKQRALRCQSPPWQRQCTTTGFLISIDTRASIHEQHACSWWQKGAVVCSNIIAGRLKCWGRGYSQHGCYSVGTHCHSAAEIIFSAYVTLHGSQLKQQDCAAADDIGISPSLSLSLSPIAAEPHARHLSRAWYHW